MSYPELIHVDGNTLYRTEQETIQTGISVIKMSCFNYAIHVSRGLHVVSGLNVVSGSNGIYVVQLMKEITLWEECLLCPLHDPYSNCVDDITYL